MTNKTQEAWKQLAKAWLSDEGGTKLHCREGLLDKPVIEALGVISNKTILDLGCGDGRFARMLAQRGAKVIGVDLCEEFIQFAKNHPDKSAKETFLLDDAHTLSLQPDNHFDSAISYISLIDFSNITAIAQTLNRVLKPGGRLVICNVHPLILGSTETFDDIIQEKGLDLSTYFEEGTRAFNVYQQSLPAYHRTLSTTINSFIKSGFSLLELIEPQATKEQVEEYPALGDSDKLPVFILYTFEKQ